jgi:acyl-CoA hydrolase
MRPERIALDAIPRRMVRGDCAYIQGATGEIQGLQTAFAADPERLAGVRLVSCLVPGMNRFDYAAIHPEARVDCFMSAPHLHRSIAAGGTRVLPFSYSQIGRHIAATRFDLAIVTVTPAPDGGFSFGTCVDFGPLTAARAKQVIGIVNTAMPCPPRSPRLPAEAFDAIVEVHEPLTAIEAGTISPELAAIGRLAVGFIPDHAHIQTGIGSAPAAVWQALGGHRGLALRSGMVTPDFLDLHRKGAMMETGHGAGILVGDGNFATAIAEADLVAFADVRTTHDTASLAALDRFVAVNSALEVDLFGQANLEWLDGRQISGVGGSPDFARAAMASRGGRSILVLQATARGGTLSRIRPQLKSPASLGRLDVDVVITEFGAADLRGTSMDERANALIAIAAPAHRAMLAEAWGWQRRAA